MKPEVCHGATLRTTSAEWTPWAIASAQAASTAGSPSLSTAVRMSTIWRLPSSALASLRRTRSIAAGSTQSLKGAPLRSVEHWHVVPWVIDRVAAAERAGMLPDDPPVLTDHDAIRVGMTSTGRPTAMAATAYAPGEAGEGRLAEVSCRVKS
jgi:hypothetical protein